jgi:hypothetical protein
MAWLLALAVIAGASPVMAASYAGDGPTISQSSNSLPTAPVQAALDEGFASFIEDESSRRFADHGDGSDITALVTAELALPAFGIARDATAGHRTRLTADVPASCHKTGPPTA